MNVYAIGSDRSAAASPKAEEPRPIRAAKLILNLPGRMRDAVTRPLASRAVAYWCSGEHYEMACLAEAHRETDKAIRKAATLVKKGNQDGISPEEWHALEELAALLGEVKDGIDVVGCTTGIIGRGLKWAGRKISQTSHGMFERGQSLSQSNSKTSRAAGKALAAASYIPWVFSCAPTAMGHVLEIGAYRAPGSPEAIRARKQIAEEVFLPLILQSNAVVKRNWAQGCLNGCANTAYLYAVGAFNPQSWTSLSSSAVSLGTRGLFAAQAALGGWIWAPAAKTGIDVLSAPCRKKDVAGLLKQEWIRENTSFAVKWRNVPGGIDFLLRIFLDSRPLIGAFCENSPETFMREFCDAGEAIQSALVIPIRHAGERN